MDIKLSIDELDLDQWGGEDVDNSTLRDGVQDPQGVELTRLEQFEATRQINSIIKKEDGSALTAAARYVPLKRIIKYPNVGNDVLAVKRALAKSGASKWGDWGLVHNLYGTNARRHVRTFQQRHGLHVDGVYGLNTHKKLMPFFDSYGAYLMGSYKPPLKKSGRDQIVAAAMFGYANRESIHYTESSWRMYGVRNHIKPPQIPRYEDCSSFSTWCYYVAGVPDPNGLGYNGQGYTGTLVQHGRAITLASVQPGDLVFYGGSYSVPGHVAIAVGSGRVVSHGSEDGPLLLPLTYRGITEIRSYF